MRFLLKPWKDIMPNQRLHLDLSWTVSSCKGLSFSLTFCIIFIITIFYFPIPDSAPKVGRRAITYMAKTTRY
ncbi:hypothetical protein K432DRAFT_57199 [Lepidopterella palustris CBS 459.81]|uniref:Uncharacterized protein n=1 Tax=Lepidopterella palustris CBS 459.81 TaxID=1314670 RepID=A0A8E2JEN5_9PEZI|nr:hypothetical protein K432DRAFT_57199 [Lepidopterella palustris CBS 459.81]